MHPSSRRNLNRWPKGVSGNPSGRPKEIIRPLVRGLMTGRPLSEIRELAESAEELDPAQATAVKLIDQTLSAHIGQLSSMHALVELVDGRQVQAIETDAPLAPAQVTQNLVVLLQQNAPKLAEALRLAIGG